MQGIKNLTHGPINRQLFNLAMPIMATSFIQMAYSLTDMAWGGRLGSEAVAAIVDLARPVIVIRSHWFCRNPDMDVRFYLPIK